MIVVCTYGLSPGGAERQWVYLSQAISKLGMPVTFVTYEPLEGARAHYVPLLRNAGVRLMDASAPSAPIDRGMGTAIETLSCELGFGEWGHTCIARLAGAFTALAPQVVYTQLDEPNIFAGVAARLCQVERCVLSFRNHNPTEFEWIHQEWMLPSYRWLDGWSGIRYTANSQGARESYASWLSISEERIRFIPNMRPLETTDVSPTDIQALRVELGLDDDQPMVLGVFRLHPEKNPSLFLEVAREVLSAVPRCVFVLVGDGPLRNDFRRRARELGIQNDIRLLGARQDVPVLMAAATVLLHTSRREGMSNVLMEAQASGLPVVACAGPGVGEIVDDGHSALLCSPGDSIALASSCRAILTQRGLGTRMGEAGRHFAATNFEMESVRDAYLATARAFHGLDRETP